MTFHLPHLDQRTRRLMLAEIDHDVARDRLYLSDRLSDHGRTHYPDALRAAVLTGNEQSLAAVIASHGFLNEQELSHRNGRAFSKKVPHDAHQTMAEGEFNRFYMRGLCVRADEDGHEHVQVYRAKVVNHPRPESELMIGKLLRATALLADLRVHIGVEAALGLPRGPNSGLSARLLAHSDPDR